MKVKRIDEKNFWVFKDPKFPVKVKLFKQKDQYRLECKCFRFQRIGVCPHVKAVMETVTNIKYVQPKQKKISVPEFIGGDLRQQIANLLKSVSF